MEPAGGKPGGDNAWQFVNFSDPVQRKSRDLQRVVRANAMRHFRKEQRQKTAQNRYGKSGTSSNRIDGSVVTREVIRDSTLNRPFPLRPAQTSSKVLLPSPPSPVQGEHHPTMYIHDSHHALPAEEAYPGEAQQQYLMSHSNPNISLGLGLGDPFNTLPIESSSGNINHILHHCKPLES